MQAILPPEVERCTPPELEADGLVLWGRRGGAPFSPAQPLGLALGFFDGVHRAHRLLIEHLLWAAREEGFTPAVLTFDHLPGKTERGGAPLAAGAAPGRIQSARERAEQLCAKGVVHVLEQHFSERLRRLSPEAFVEELTRRFALRYLVVGEDFRFGQDRGGDAQCLRRLCAERGVRVEIVAEVQGYGEAISSSRIRALLLRGEADRAQRLMGRPFIYGAEVVRGRAFARTVGMPTVNMRVEAGKLCLPYGVYASRTRIGGRFYRSISNFGLRPTVNAEDRAPLLETHIFDFAGDLYGQFLEVSILGFLRAERRFASRADMVRQMRADAERAERWLGERELLEPVAEIDGISCYHLPARRFAQAYLHFSLRLPADARKNSARALALRMVLQRSARYPSRRQFSLAQDALYGAVVDGFCERVGPLHSVEFSVEALALGLRGERPFEEACLFLLDALKRPLLDADGLFDEGLFVTERNNLCMELRARTHNRAMLAADRSMARLLEGRPEGLSPRGELELIPGLSREEVTEAWFELLACGRHCLASAGHLDAAFHEKMAAALQDFRGARRAQPAAASAAAGEAACAAALSAPLPRFAAPRRVREYLRLEQGRLLVYWQGLGPAALLQGAVFNLLNSLFGADSHSLLFEEVRERLGLAYSLHTYPLKHLGLLVLSAGVRADAVDQAVEACRAQLRRLAENRFAERVFKSSRAMVEARLQALGDSLQELLLYQLGALEADKAQDLADAACLLQTVGREALAAMAAGLSECLVYELLPLEQGGASAPETPAHETSGPGASAPEAGAAPGGGRAGDGA